LQALERYDVLDTEPEEAFDRITRLAKSVLGLPMVLVSLVDAHRQWFKSRQGVTATETERGISFCTHTIRSAQTFIVKDAHVDARFAQSPLVVQDPFIRFYIGVPLRTRDGHNIGALCAMDTEVRELASEQIRMLEDLARLVVDELELRLLAAMDSLTGSMTRRAFRERAELDIERARRYCEPLSCVVVDVDNFKQINDTHGHAAGDIVLQHVVSACMTQLRSVDYLGRIGGDEYAVMLPETSLVNAFAVADRLRKKIESTAVEFAKKLSELPPVSASLSFGVKTNWMGCCKMRTQRSTTPNSMARIKSPDFSAT
jgi:diguanylate cyclase (GGDEF)-like protein